MKHLMIVALVALMLTGCSGVILSPGYSRQLDETAALAGSFARDARAGRMDANDMMSALDWNAAAWKCFQDARDGRDPNSAPK